MRTFSLAAAVSAALWAQTARPTFELANDRMQVILLQQGGAVASMVLTNDPEKLNPLWHPTGIDTGGIGSFLCIDAFGPTSPEELKAGLQFHGEAIRTTFNKIDQPAKQGVSAIAIAADLPLVQERVVRTYELKQGETVLYIRTRVESKVGFDRPMVWAEHGTIGAPFLEREATVVDFPAARAQTRPYTERARRRLAPGKEFTWPNAPLADGGTVDLRAAPAQSNSGDHSTALMNPGRQYAFATAINKRRHLAVGWIWRRSDFPWLQNWENYPAQGMLARGLEFSTQPFDISRRDAVALSGMFDAPTFRWLPAKSAVETNFVIFYTRVPEGFDQVKDVQVQGGTLTLVGADDKRVAVPASLSF